MGLAVVEHAHVPLVINAEGDRLAKRDGAVTLADLAELGVDATEVRGRLASTLGLAESGETPSMDELLDRYDPAALPLTESVWNT